MSFYENRILPRLVHLAMRSRELVPYRKRIAAAAEGRILEIGMGSGLNLPFYGPSAGEIIGIEPAEPLVRMSRDAAAKARLPVTLVQGSAEQIPLDDRSVDTVLTTWTMCTIPDAAQALREMRRVLRPGGQLLFVEHGLAPDNGVRNWQHRLTPLWKRVAGGCHLDRPISALVERAGFRLDGLETGYARGPRPLAFFYEGRARP